MTYLQIIEADLKRARELGERAWETELVWELTNYYAKLAAKKR